MPEIYLDFMYMVLDMSHEYEFHVLTNFTI
jgi:hypothetical protein